jgi:hypothetical protein
MRVRPLPPALRNHFACCGVRVYMLLFRFSFGLGEG